MSKKVRKKNRQAYKKGEVLTIIFDLLKLIIIALVLTIALNIVGL